MLLAQVIPIAFGFVVIVVTIYSDDTWELSNMLFFYHTR